MGNVGIASNIWLVVLCCYEFSFFNYEVYLLVYFQFRGYIFGFEIYVVLCAFICILYNAAMLLLIRFLWTVGSIVYMLVVLSANINKLMEFFGFL